MNRRLTSAVFLFLSLALSCCRTMDKTAGTKSFEEIDYTASDSAQTEADRIRLILDSEENVRALWRAKLLVQNNDCDISREILSLCEEAVVGEYKTALEEEDSMTALRCFSSLEACSYAGLSSLSVQKAELTAQSVQNVPGLKKSLASQQKVSSYIRGTVTVYVDKGFKVSHGMGVQDATLGSGFFISEDGYIVTNHHVISDVVDPAYEGFSRLYIKLADDPDTRIPAKVVGWDSVLDLALLKTEVTAPYVFSLGSSSDLDVGDRVYAIGSPLGLDRTLTSGIISATDRRLFTEGVVFQIDAAVNSGNSGGPLIDEAGRVQAVVFAGVENYQGLNFAIPVEYLRNELPILFAGGKRTHPWIGAYGRTNRLSGASAKNNGVLVQYVMPGGSAYRAGIRPDDIIEAVDGTVISSLDDLQNKFMQMQSGVVCRVRVRNTEDEKKTVLVYLDERPSSPGYEIYQTDIIEHSLLPIFGMELLRSSASNKKMYTVTKVLKASSADDTSFSEGDPVQILGIEFDKTKSYIYVTLYTQRRKNGWLEMSLQLASSLDSAYYF